MEQPATVVISAATSSAVRPLARVFLKAHAPLAEGIRKQSISRAPIYLLRPVVAKAALPGRLATAAVLDALLALVAGVGRTSLAMARENDLPRWLAAVHPRYRIPHHAEIGLAVVVSLLVLTVDLRGVIGFSSFGVLLYYLVANLSAFMQKGQATPVAAATWFAAQGGVQALPEKGWHASDRNKDGVTLRAGSSSLHVVQGSDGTAQVDSGTHCG